MPKTTFQRVIFTLIGVLLMATTMATFNKYLIYGEFSLELFRQVGVALLQKGPLAFVLQFFFVQKFASKQASKYPTDNQILYSAIRIGFTVIIMAPTMCAYSNLFNAVKFHWTLGQYLSAVISKTPINWIFAFCVQIWILKPLNRLLFRALFKKQLSAA